MIPATDRGGLFGDFRRGNRRRWNEERIQSRFRHSRMEMFDERIPQLHGFQIGGRRNLGAHSQARQHIFSVVSGARRIPSSLLMVMRGFGPGDLVSRIFGFLHERDGYRFESSSLLAEESDAFLERARNLPGKLLKKKRFRETETESVAGGRFGRLAQRELFFRAHENRIEQSGSISRATRQRANTIEPGRKWNDASDRHAAKRRF